MGGAQSRFTVHGCDINSLPHYGAKTRAPEIVVGFSSFVQLFFFLRWLHRRTRDDEIRRAFVRDMAINHLPHLYHALRQIAGNLGIQLKEPPPVQFLELNGHDRKR